MATAEQIKMLIKSHGENDNQRFYAAALQIAAREARLGHTKLANDLKNLIEKYQFKNVKQSNSDLLGLKSHQHDLDGLIEFSMPHIHRASLVLDENTFSRIELIIHEQRQRNELGKYGLHPRNKILFVGAPGTGKTLTANILASELKLPLYKVVLESLGTLKPGKFGYWILSCVIPVKACIRSIIACLVCSKVIAILAAILLRNKGKGGVVNSLWCLIRPPIF